MATGEGGYIVVQAARGRHSRKIGAKSFGVIHRSPVYNPDLNKSTSVCKVGDLEGFPKAFLDLETYTRP